MDACITNQAYAAIAEARRKVRRIEREIDTLRDELRDAEHRLDDLEYDLASACEGEDADRIDEHVQRASNDEEPTA